MVGWLFFLTDVLIFIIFMYQKICIYMYIYIYIYIIYILYILYIIYIFYIYIIYILYICYIYNLYIYNLHIYVYIYFISIYKIVAVESLSHVWLFNPTDCSTSGSCVLHYLLDFAQSHVHWVALDLVAQTVKNLLAM